jgi:diguanylate cyclase
VTLSITDQDIIASIQSQLDGLRQTADGEILYRLIERGLKRRDQDYDGDTGNAFVAFLHNILGRYAATPTGDTVTRVKVRLIQQRIAPHMMEAEGGPASVETTPEPIETPVEEIKTETPVSPPGPEEDPVVDPLQAALDQLLADDAAHVSQEVAEEASPPKSEPMLEDSAASTDTADEPSATDSSPASESRPPRYRPPPEEEIVPRADPSRPLFEALDDLEFIQDESISPDPVIEPVKDDPVSAEQSPKTMADESGDGSRSDSAGLAQDTISVSGTESAGIASPAEREETGDKPESAVAPTSQTPSSLAAAADKPVPAAKDSAAVEEKTTRSKQSEVLPSAETTVPMEETPVSPGDAVAEKAAPRPEAATGTRKVAQPDPARPKDTARNTSGSATAQQLVRKKQKRVAKVKTKSAPKPKPKPSKPLELQDTWGPAAPEPPPPVDDGDPDIVVGEPTKPLFPPSDPPSMPVAATRAGSPTIPETAIVSPSPAPARPSSVPAAGEVGRTGSRQRVDQLHETFANKLADSISRSREYHTMLRSTLKTLKLADKSRDSIDLKRLLQTGLEELLQSSESLGKDLGATSHYLRISQLDRDLLKDELVRVRDQSLVDELTGLHNRAGFIRQLEAEIGRTKRYGFSLSVAVLHMEALAEIAARHGSDAVDEVLRTYAKEILSHFRGYDWVARIGEHRFGILFPNTQKEGAMTALDKAHKRASSMVIRHKATSIKIPPFTSVLTLYHPGDKPDVLLQRADEAFALAKEQDRDRIIVALPGA